MSVYLDSSALVKRYVDEPGSDLVRDEMQRAARWFMCRVGFVETVRAVGLTAGPSAVEHVRAEWPSIDALEVDDRLTEEAAKVTLEHELRSLDALHLAAALTLPRDDLFVMTWDRRLGTAAVATGLRVVPDPSTATT